MISHEYRAGALCVSAVLLVLSAVYSARGDWLQYRPELGTSSTGYRYGTGDVAQHQW